jgi:hypothetical protein
MTISFNHVNDTITILNATTGANTANNLGGIGTLNVSSNLAVTGTGAIYMPNRPAFRVIGNGGSITASNTVTSTNWTLDYQQGSSLNQTTGIFTAPISGLYSTYLVMRTFSNTNATINQAIIYKTSSGTDTVAAMLEFGINTTMNHAGIGTNIKLLTGDTLKLNVAVGTLSFDSNDNWSVAYIG